MQVSLPVALSLAADDSTSDFSGMRSSHKVNENEGTHIHKHLQYSQGEQTQSECACEWLCGVYLCGICLCKLCMYVCVYVCVV